MFDDFHGCDGFFLGGLPFFESRLKGFAQSRIGGGLFFGESAERSLDVSDGAADFFKSAILGVKFGAQLLDQPGLLGSCFELADERLHHEGELVGDIEGGDFAYRLGVPGVDAGGDGFKVLSGLIVAGLQGRDFLLGGFFDGLVLAGSGELVLCLKLGFERRLGVDQAAKRRQGADWCLCVRRFFWGDCRRRRGCRLLSHRESGQDKG